MFMFLAPISGMPRMDIAAVLGALFDNGRAPSPQSTAWWMGMAFHFVNGSVIFPFIYANWLSPQLPGASWFKGCIWGLMLWFLAQALFMPFMGMGFFAAKTAVPLLSVAGSLAGHLIYGGILGTLAGPYAIHAPFFGRYTHARGV
jgi:uncharacterized membrane protein YagU involved in acid resistance